MEWTIKSYEELSRDEFYEILKARIDIFVVEQDCPYTELDGKDKEAFHLLGRRNGELIAYARLFKPGAYFSEAAIGRVLVKAAHRSRGYGQEMMEKAISFLEEKGADKIMISGQEYLLDFYQELGFEPISEVYLEDDIPHIKMLYTSR